MQLAHAGLVTSCAHRHRFKSGLHLRSRVAEKNMRKILEVFVVFVLTCFTSVLLIDVLTWLLKGAASGSSKDRNRTAGEDHSYDDSDQHRRRLLLTTGLIPRANENRHVTSAGLPAQKLQNDIIARPLTILPCMEQLADMTSPHSVVLVLRATLLCTWIS